MLEIEGVPLIMMHVLSGRKGTFPENKREPEPASRACCCWIAGACYLSRYCTKHFLPEALLKPQACTAAGWIFGGGVVGPKKTIPVRRTCDARPLQRIPYVRIRVIPSATRPSEVPAPKSAAFVIASRWGGDIASTFAS